MAYLGRKFGTCSDVPFWSVISACLYRGARRGSCAPHLAPAWRDCSHGILSGVYPTDAKACYTVDSLAGGIEDFIGKFIKAHPNFGGSKVCRASRFHLFFAPSPGP